MRGVLLAYMTDVPEEFPDGTPARYELTSYGHYQGHSSIPNLFVELKAVTPGELSQSVRNHPRAMIPRPTFPRTDAESHWPGGFFMPRWVAVSQYLL